MTTEPFDIGDVISAAGGEPWSGAPAGTTIGQMHLHVGHLGEARGLLSLGPRPRQDGMSRVRRQPRTKARLLEWELVVPDEGDPSAAAGACAPQDIRCTPTAPPGLRRIPGGTLFRMRAQL
jgi:hypothetical protein